MERKTGGNLLPIYTSGIRSVSYRPASDLDTSAESRAPVSTYSMFDLSQPRPGGVFDANMGTTVSSYVCATCQLSTEKCHGHPGSFQLSYPCFNPIAIQEIKKWLKVICFNCGNIVVDEDTLRSRVRGVRPSLHLDTLAKSMSPATIRNCATCGKPHFVVKRPDDKTEVIFLLRSSVSERPVNVPLYPHDVLEIFEKVRDSTVAALGRNPLAHPRNLVWKLLYIPPPAIRPDTKRSGGRGSNDSITSRLRDLIRQALKLRGAIPQVIDVERAADIKKLGMLLDELLLRGNDRSKSIAMRLKSKDGRFRDNLLGKRVFGMGRSTIDGSPRLNLDQLSIPLFVAQTLQIEETVQDFNRERLMMFVANGTSRYPGCTRIIKRNGRSYAAGAAHLQIENGDVISRDLVNGDVVAYNRQPTLTLSNITSLRIVVDKTALANGMSTLTCPFYNADFDGDQMNVFNYAKPASLNEQIMMTNVASRMISATTGGMVIGQAGDSLMGLAKITQSGVLFDKYHACLIFSSANSTPNLSKMSATVTGRELVSVALARVPISYSGKSTYYNPDAFWAKWVPTFSTDDAIVEIKSGTLVRGCLDKSSVGAGGGSIYQRMMHEYGAANTLDVMYDMQQIGINYISQHGFTTGIHDFHILPEEYEKITRTTQAKIEEADQIVEQLHHQRIIPPIDKTILQFYEESQKEKQRVVEEYYEPATRSIRTPRANGIFEMMASGCKGSPTFFVNMVAAVGLILINGERVRTNFGYARTLPYFPRYEEAPEARGFVRASFMQGLPVVGTIFNAMMARTDIISRALMTSVTGDQNRKSIKSLESIITNNFRMNVKGPEIVSLIYGGDYFDARRLEVVQYGPALISDADFVRDYKMVAADPSEQGVFDAEFAQLTADRAEYRRIFKTIEDMSIRDKMGKTFKLPFNISRIAERIRAAGGDRAGASHVHLATAVKMVRAFCDEAPYMFMNEDQRRAGGWIPTFMGASCTLICMYVRAELCAMRVRAHAGGIDLVQFLNEVLGAIRSIVLHALVDPGNAVGIIAAQSFSEPFTQDMLDASKLSALTGGNVSRMMMRKCREIMSAQSVERLLNPIMTVALEGPAASSMDRAQEVARAIEMLRFEQLVESGQIFFETFGEPIHPKYAHEREMFATFAADNPLFPVPSDLLTWCIRFELNRNILVQKNITVAAAVIALRQRFGDALYFVFTTERSATVVVRAYVRASQIEQLGAIVRKGDRDVVARGRAKHDTGARMQDIYTAISDTIIRGVKGINLAIVDRLVRTRIDETGAVVDDPACFCVKTGGTNMTGVALVPGVRASHLQTDAIQELASVLGIEAARYRIIIEMRRLIDKCNLRHYMIYADEMTRTGRVTSIERGGLSLREVNNVALRAGHAAPVQVFTDAALNTRRDELLGVSGPLIFGTVPRVGTLYNAMVMDPAVVAKYKKSAQQVLESL